MAAEHDAVLSYEGGGPNGEVRLATSGIGSAYLTVKGRSLVERVEAFEAWLCKDALERTRYVQKEAAAVLGLSYDQFRQRYRKYGLGKE